MFDTTRFGISVTMCKRLVLIGVVGFAVFQTGCWRYMGSFNSISVVSARDSTHPGRAIFSVLWDGQQSGTGDPDHPAVVPPERIGYLLANAQTQLDPRFAQHASSISAELAQVPGNWVIALQEGEGLAYYLLVQGQMLRLYRMTHFTNPVGVTGTELVAEVPLYDAVPQQTTAAGCANDMDCKGDRRCVNGACVD